MENDNSIISISNISEEVISEKDLPCLLENYENQGLKYIENFECLNALNQFKRMEEIMESISAQGGLMNSDHIIATLHNLAFCSQE